MLLDVSGVVGLGPTKSWVHKWTLKEDTIFTQNFIYIFYTTSKVLYLFNSDFFIWLYGWNCAQGIRFYKILKIKAASVCILYFVSSQQWIIHTSIICEMCVNNKGDVHIVLQEKKTRPFSIHRRCYTIFYYITCCSCNIIGFVKSFFHRLFLFSAFNMKAKEKKWKKKEETYVVEESTSFFSSFTSPSSSSSFSFIHL